MELDARGVDGARDAWRSGRHAALESAQFTTLSLGASLEAACWAAEANDASALSLIRRWSVGSSTFEQGYAALISGQAPPRPGEHDAPASELARCPSRSELVDSSVGVEWRYFLDRFRRSLIDRLRLTPGRARGIAGALGEMVDNVVQHAGLGDTPRGIIGYEVSEAALSFAVADLGRGVLSSLRDNPTHRHISTDAAALVSAVTTGASSRPGVAGTGFADLNRALADLDGYLTFRSGSARLFLDGRGGGARRHNVSNSPEMIGFQLSVTAQPQKSVW